MTDRIQTRFLVVDSGVAGLHTARRASEYGEVLLLTKRSLFDSATAYAQGGIASVLGPDDDVHRDLQLDDFLRPLGRAGVVYRGAVRIDRDRNGHVFHLEFVDRFHAEVFERDVPDREAALRRVFGHARLYQLAIAANSAGSA